MELLHTVGQHRLGWPCHVQLFQYQQVWTNHWFVNNGDSSLNSLMVLDANLKRAADSTGDKPFDFIVLQLGTNDGKAVFADRQHEVPEHMQQLIHQIQSSAYKSINQAKVIIVSPPPYGSKAEATAKYKGGGMRVKDMSKAFAKIARRNHCLFVNGYKTPGLDIEMMTADGLHLDATASRKLIEPVVRVMLKYQASK